MAAPRWFGSDSSSSDSPACEPQNGREGRTIRHLCQAVQALDSGDQYSAVRLLRAVAEADPRNRKARALLRYAADED